MSTAAPETLKVVATASCPDLKIYMHSPLLYWWPVWAVGFLMALWTYVDNYHVVLVPESAVVAGNQLTVPEGSALEGPSVHMARSKVPGMVFVCTLLLVIVGSHVSLRGIWSLFALASMAAAIFLAGWLEWWGPVFRWLGLVRIHINLGGYLVISAVLLVVWCLAFFVFDRRTYLIASVGQIRVRDELGEQERAYDTTNIAFEKRPYDWFRWLLGFGAGDMVIRVGGSQPQTIELLNVVRVEKWLSQMEQRLRTRDVV